MAMRFAARVLVVAVITVAVFGLFLILAQPMHHDGCPLMRGHAVCTNTIIEHASLWQLMLASILGALVVLVGFAFVVFYANDLFMAPERVRYRAYRFVPQRPTLFQELYSDGIHNCKEHHCF